MSAGAVTVVDTTLDAASGRVGVGIVGLGSMGRQHVDICAHLAPAHPVVVFDADASLTQSVAETYGVRPASSLDQLLDAPEVTAVIIATPDHLHVDVFDRCLRAGKHVLIEKPIASDLADARQMLALAGRTTRCVMVGHTLRFDRRYYLAAKEVADGRLGRLMHIYARRHNRADTGVRVGDRATITVFLGVHDLDAMMWIAQSRVARVAAVAAPGDRDPQRGSGPASVMALLEFTSGAIGCLEVSWALPQGFPSPLDAQLEAVFSDGCLHLQASSPGLAVFAQDRLSMPPALGGEVHGYPTGPVATEIECFLRCIRDGVAPPVSAEDGFNAVAVAAAIDLAWRSGQPQSVDYSR